MKVKMLVSITGTRNGADWPQRGGFIDLPIAEAHDMIAAGLCAVVEGGTAPDASTTPATPVAAVDEGEIAVKKRAATRTRKADAV